MKISLNWIKEYVDLPGDLDLQQICHDLTMATVEVEGAVHAEAALEAIYVGEVLSVAPIKNTDKLRAAVCEVGGKKYAVVCGAKNVASGMMVPIALPGAKIQPHGTGNIIEVGIAKVRGVPSEAVICAANEIGLDNLFTDAVDGILDLSAYDCTSGQKLADFLGWNDIILEIDNKSLTNRPDLWGHYGIAREMAAIYGSTLKELPAAEFHENSDGLGCEIEDPNTCRRFVTTRIENVKIEPAPFWMRSRLAVLGQKCINLFVDLTNYVMLGVGQPSHVFDRNQVTLPLKVRQANSNEKLTLLDGNEIKLTSETPVVADQNQPVSLAGVMGGLDSSVTSVTGEIVYECANFHPLYIRRSASRFNVRTESSSRYEKSLDPDRIHQALGLFQSLLADAQPEARITGMADLYPQKTSPISVRVSLDFLQDRLGLRIENEKIVHLLESLGFGIHLSGDNLDVSVPSWRATGDVSLQEDIVEEVARLYGYEKFPYIAPEVKLNTAVLQTAQKQQRRIREYCAFTCGMREVVTYPWAEERMLKATGLENQTTVNLDMPPAPELSRLRTTLVPNMVRAVSDNLRYFTSFRIFELGRVFLDTQFNSQDNEKEMLPEQPYHLSGAIVGADAQEQFLLAKGVLERMGRGAQVHPITCADMTSDAPAWADPVACVKLEANGRSVGAMALISPRTRRLVGIKHGQAAIFEINMDAFEAFASRSNEYKTLPKYPQVEFDFSLVFPADCKWQDIRREADAVHEMVCETRFVDEYQGENLPRGSKSVTLRLILGSPDGTLTSEQVQQIADGVIERLKHKFGTFDR